MIFQSTRPVRGATAGHQDPGHCDGISIHAPRAGRDTKAAALRAGDIISIHAPRAGRDFGGVGEDGLPGDFNPRAPCGARPGVISLRPGSKLFQSTRPVRGATLIILNSGAASRRFQSTRPVRGATSPVLPQAYNLVYFNPRAPCGARR